MTDTIPPPKSSYSNLSASNPQNDHHQTVSYLISSSENHLGKLCWQVRDLQNRLIFKSFKELAPTEIIESVQDLSGESLWSIHRPIRGWYLALRPPKFTNSHDFIALEPSNATKGKNKLTEFTFRLKSSSFSSPYVSKPANGHHKHLNANFSVKRRHPSISNSPKSPKQSTSRCPSPENEWPQQAFDSFIVCLRPIEQDLKQTSIFSSLTKLFLNNNLKFECFIDTPIIPSPNNNHPPSLRKSGIPEPATAHHPRENLSRLVLFDYEDQNSIFGIQNNGILKLHLQNTLKLHLLDDDHHFNDLRCHQSFWISVCIAYLGFRADQEAYVAAIQGE